MSGVCVCNDKSLQVNISWIHLPCHIQGDCDIDKYIIGYYTLPASDPMQTNNICNLESGACYNCSVCVKEVSAHNISFQVAAEKCERVGHSITTFSHGKLFLHINS